MNTMNYTQALGMMSLGHVVKQQHFTSEEYFYMDTKGVVRDENGYDMTSWWKGEPWQDEGWSIANVSLETLTEINNTRFGEGWEEGAVSTNIGEDIAWQDMIDPRATGFYKERLVIVKGRTLANMTKATDVYALREVNMELDNDDLGVVGAERDDALDQDFQKLEEIACALMGGQIYCDSYDIYRGITPVAVKAAAMAVDYNTPKLRKGKGHNRLQKRGKKK